MEKTCLFVIGYPGAGKTTVASSLKSLGYPVVSMGDTVRSHARDALGDSTDSRDVAAWVTNRREESDTPIVAEWTLPEVLAAESKTVVVEGLRTYDEYEFFSEQVDRTVLIEVTAPIQQRLQRLRERGRGSESAFTMDDLQDRDREEEEWGLEELLVECEPDISVCNDGSKLELSRNVREGVAQVLGQTADESEFDVGGRHMERRIRSSVAL